MEIALPHEPFSGPPFLLLDPSLTYTSVASSVVIVSINPVFVELGVRVSFFGCSFRSNALFLMLAIIPQLIGHSTFNWALKFFSASTVAVLTLGESIGSTLLAYWILGETLNLWKAIGRDLCSTQRGIMGVG